MAIHRSGGFAPRWKDAAGRSGFRVREVDGYGSDVMRHLDGCDALLWHLNQDESVDLEHARSILFSAEAAGMRVFPNGATCWHFDDKVAQKYLLEAIGAPLAKTWVYFSKEEALSFLDTATYPLVFKLRRGAGSMNVRLVRDQRQGASLANRMFTRGLNPHPPIEGLRRAAVRAMSTSKDRRLRFDRVWRVLKRLVAQTTGAQRERGYVLFQEFVPENNHDIRATVIGDRCFVFRRDVRPNDFRASGSGKISYYREMQVPRDAVELAFSISRRLGFQSMAYDFVRSPDDGRLILLEISFVFNADAVAGCPGYFDSDGNWIPGSVWPEEAILEDLLS